MPNTPLPEWEALLASAAHLQKIVPEAVLVGGTAAASYAHHRVSVDHDHTLSDLRQRFDTVLATLESVAGWRTARVKRPVLILGSLDGIETGIRQLIRDAPLETETIEVVGEKLTVPTKAEMLRIKAVLIIRRNATKGIGPNEVFSHLGLSHTTVGRAFRNVRGTTVQDEIAKVRLGEAQRLLSDTSQPVNLVARNAGYSSTPYFCRSFVEATGLNPSDWRLKRGCKPFPKVQ